MQEAPQCKTKLFKRELQRYVSCYVIVLIIMKIKWRMHRQRKDCLIGDAANSLPRDPKRTR